ncbi:flagellar filament capping protein FliD [bacterium]|nr:flagellar filament capping protein FliD [bacterium]
MALTAAGVGSGIDIESILEQLGEIERQPIVNLETKREELDVELSAFGTVKSALSTFQSAADLLGNSDDFGAFVATSSDEAVFTATSSGGEVAENLEIEVLSLATNHRLSSAAYASADSTIDQGSFTFTSGDNSFQIDVDDSNDTLTGLRDAINDRLENTTMSASIISVDGGSRLILTANESGTDGQIGVSQNSGDTNAGFEEITEATDASLIVHGFQVSRSSNSISDVIDGVTLDLTGVGKSTVDTRRDLTSLKTALDEFVTAYNTMNNSLTQAAQTDLQGDQLPRGIEKRVREIFFDVVDLGEGDSASALDMGFSFDRYGTLNLDNSQYEAAIEQGVNRFVDVFSKSDTGISSLFSDLVDEYTQSGGIIASREDGVDTRKSSIDSQIERLEYRLEKTNTRLRAQFTAMDLAVTNLQTTSSFLTSRLG